MIVEDNFLILENSISKDQKALLGVIGVPPEAASDIHLYIRRQCLLTQFRLQKRSVGLLRCVANT